MASQEGQSLEAQFQQLKMEYEKERTRREQAERARDEAERARDEAERVTRRTTLFEFLDAIHTHLSLTLTIERDATLATKGDPSNATGKLCPKFMRPWEDFLDQQDAMWSQLHKLSDTVKTAQVFAPVLSLETAGEAISTKKISSEKDLEFYERGMVENQVSRVIFYLSTDPLAREIFCLNGSVEFENHPNTLSSDNSEVVERMEQMNFRTPDKTSAKRTGSRPPQATDSASTLMHTDQICVYSVAENQKVACFIIEYKAPHKVTLVHFQAGLRPMDPMREVVHSPTMPSKDQHEEQIAYHSSHLVAAVVTQTFSYMIESGLQYGYICTGEAFVFLHIRAEDPTTVYYHLAIPNLDVESSTEWSTDPNGANWLRWTAVGQVLAFTLRALQKPSLGPEWIDNAKDQLEIWKVDSQVVLEQIPETVRKEIRNSTYKPSRRQLDLLTDKSPYFLRLRNTNVCGPRTSKITDDNENDDSNYEEDNDDGIDTPTRPSVRKHSSKQSAASRKRYDNRNSNRALAYCTQRCLRGLLKGGMLDKACPNHELHRKHGRRHSISSETFLSLMQLQLSENLEADCYPLHIQGARGALFQVRLISHGYTVAAKCTIYAFISDLLHEGLVYKQLENIQGIHIPVCLGNIDLDRVLSYNCGVQLRHMMFMAWGGKRIDYQRPAPDPQLVRKQAISTLDAIHDLGILHKDVMPRNMLWNEEVQRVMIIDFERSVIMTPKPALAPPKRPLVPISPNRKRKRTPEADGKTMIDCREQGQEQGIDKPKMQIFTEGKGENGVYDVKPRATEWEAAFANEVNRLKNELDDLKLCG